MENGSNAIVVGGGPCGSYTALKLAEQGLTVKVFEEHREIGVPSHCPGHVSIKGLGNLGLFPLPKHIVENTFYGANFYSPEGRIFSVRFPSPMTCTVDRVLFDKHIAKMAKDSGAQYYLDSHVKSLIVDDDFVRGVGVKHGDTVVKEPADVVVDAEGISSRLLRQAGLTPFHRLRLVNGVQAEVENIKDVDPDVVEVFFGNDYCPGFFGWLIPINDGKAKVGLAARKGNPRELLGKLMNQHPVASRKLRSAGILKMAFHPITLSGPVRKAFSNGFLAVGDAASHVKPTTGGGIILGLSCAAIAAEVVCEASCKGDFSAELLSPYQRQCDSFWSLDVWTMLKMRQMLDSLSDEKIEQTIAMCSRLRFDKTLETVEEIDFQGKSLLRILLDPRTMPILFHLLYIYLSANP